MIKLRITITCISIYWALAVSAQAVEYSFNNNCKIELPTKLELQDSELNSVKKTNNGKKHQVSINSHSGHITFQQRGLNANTKSAFDKYCRVIIEYFKEKSNEPTLGRGDVIPIDKDVLDGVVESAKHNCRSGRAKFIKLISLENLKINGLPVLYYSYKRQGWEGKHPPVIVNVYCVFNRYERVIITFSYRESEREMWKDIHNFILKTFKFSSVY